MDFYVTVQGAPLLWMHLMGSGGWRMLVGEELGIIGKCEGPSYMGLPFVEDIWYWYHEESDQVINVIVTEDPSALRSILEFHSTFVMNVITYFGVVSLYKGMTRKRIGWMNIRGRVLKERDEEWLEKYRLRGYTAYRDSRLGGEHGRHRCGRHVNCGQTERSLFDEGVGVVKFSRYAGTDTQTLLESLEPEFTWRALNIRCEGRTGGISGYVRHQHGFQRL
ncbi:hypothetical protein CC2G_000230 [Coprinopsis cinerea AmutBmut pab1-1]|nr:hypothetical protein CC2G_000230 [Coprinopsis cinerea AmutBmut pab1-1]